jgi:CheY-like chemotaxis protein
LEEGDALTKRPRRVLVLEDEEPWRNILIEALTKLGFAAQGAANPVEAKELLRRNFYHLLMLDISMEPGNWENDEGMQLLEELHESDRRRALRVVILSGFGNLGRQREAFTRYGVDDFLDKHDFSEKQFMSQIEEIWAKDLKINLNLEIIWQGAQDAAEACFNLRLPSGRVKRDTDETRQLGEELEDLLCRLFHQAETVVAEPMERGKSGAGVLRVQPYFPETGAGRWVVVKFGHYLDIRQEAENYERFVEPFVGGGRSTKVEAVQRTIRLGGIRYSFAGAASDRFEDFGTFFARSDIGEIARVLRDLFFDTCATWYDNRSHIIPHDLSSDYRELLGLQDLHVLDDPLRRGLKAIQGHERLKFPELGNDRTFVNPILTIADRRFVRPTYVCVTHGDLNSGNVLVDPRGSTWLIDFMRTSRGHILRDFAQLDSTVRILLLGAEEATLVERLVLEEALLGTNRFQQLDKLEMEAPLDNPALAKAFATSVHIRRLAAEKVASSQRNDMSEYHIASLFFALSFIRYWHLPTIQREHALLSAALHAEHLQY